MRLAPGSRLLLGEAWAAVAAVAIGLWPLGAAAFDAPSNALTWKRAQGSTATQTEASAGNEAEPPKAGSDGPREPAAKPAGKLKWHAAKKPPPRDSAPRELRQPAEARPLAQVLLIAPEQSRARGEATTPQTATFESTPDDPFAEPGAVILTQATLSADPFADPFGDREAPGRPSELKLFADADELQPLDEQIPEGRRPAPLPIETPDEALPGDDALQAPTDIGEELAQAPPTGVEECPKPSDLLPINKITNDIEPEPGEFPQECPMSEYAFQPRSFAMTTLAWKAGAPCHKPLYFEQPGVERYGHEWSIAGGPFLQPFVSAAHFFVSVPILPYKMGVEPLWECVYPLGFYRPGSCAPYTVGPVPISLRGAVLQSGVVTGLWFVQ